MHATRGAWRGWLQVWALLDRKTAGVRQAVPVLNVGLGYVQRWFLSVPHGQ